MDFCEREHETPVSVTVLSEENTEYDIIGILSDKPLYVRPEAGEWLPEEGGGILIPLPDGGEDRGKRGGGRVCPAGQRGSAHLPHLRPVRRELYTPSQFSYARLDQADYVGAGVNTPDELPEDVRPNRAVFVTLADFMDAGLSGNMLRVRFVSPPVEAAAGLLCRGFGRPGIRTDGRFAESQPRPAGICKAGVQRRLLRQVHALCADRGAERVQRGHAVRVLPAAEPPAAADVPVPGRNGRAHIRGHGAGGAVLHAARLYEPAGCSRTLSSGSRRSSTRCRPWERGPTCCSLRLSRPSPCSCWGCSCARCARTAVRNGAAGFGGKARPAPAPAARLLDPEELFRRYSDRAHPAHAGVFRGLFRHLRAHLHIRARRQRALLSAATAAATMRFIS